MFFNGVESPSVVFNAPDTLVTEVPAGSGTVNVTVRNTDLQESGPAQFTYLTVQLPFVRGEPVVFCSIDEDQRASGPWQYDRGIVTHAEPGVKGDRVSGATKPVTLETGLVIQAPLFVDVGDVLKVDTRTAEYQTRVT